MDALKLAMRDLAKLEDDALDGLIVELEDAEAFKPPAHDEKARKAWGTKVSMASVARAEREVRKNKRAALAAQKGEAS